MEQVTNTGLVWNPGMRVTDGTRYGTIESTSPTDGLKIKWEGDENAEPTWHELGTIQHA